MAGHPMFPQPGFSSNAPFNSRGEYISPTSIDPCVLNSSADPSSSSGAGRSNDEESAFNKSAANPYSYPMTQMWPPNSPVYIKAGHTSQGCQQAIFECNFNGNGIGIAICLPRIDFRPNPGAFQWCDDFGCSRAQLESSAAQVIYETNIFVESLSPPTNVIE
ncbi:hypothetical protein B0H10DRAFT_2226347 [Mycena sp. CBHHK59/15]|nr:hypothetical protein B0H10DRAFT_2226347 [Mycena sp. CBHHK59/15]